MFFQCIFFKLVTYIRKFFETHLSVELGWFDNKYMSTSLPLMILIQQLFHATLSPFQSDLWHACFTFVFLGASCKCTFLVSGPFCSKSHFWDSPIYSCGVTVLIYFFYFNTMSDVRIEHICFILGQWAFAINTHMWFLMEQSFQINWINIWEYDWGILCKVTAFY